MSYIDRALACILMAVYLCACAPVVPITPNYPDIPDISESQRSKWGRVGVVSLPSEAKGNFIGQLPKRLTTSGQGASEGAKGGAVGVLAATGDGCVKGGFLTCSAFILVLPITLPVGAIVGWTVGGVTTVPDDKKIDEIQSPLRVVMEESEQHGELRFAVVRAATLAGVMGVNEITSDMPIVIGQKVERPLFPDANVDTLLEVGIASVSFIGKGGADPELILHVDAFARIVDASTNEDIYPGNIYGPQGFDCAKWQFFYCSSVTFTYETVPRKFSAWSADGARLIKEEIDSAYQSLGKSIADKIFLTVQTNREELKDLKGTNSN